MHLPRLYAILDAACFADANLMFAAAEELASAGVTLLQYRNKSANARQMLGQGRELRRLLGNRVKLIMNDRADLCLAADFDGLHIGQDDLSPEAARRVIGCSPPELNGLLKDSEVSAQPSKSPPSELALSLPGPRNSDHTNQGFSPRGRLLGVSTHNPEQLAEADKTSADYLAIGPVFATASKANPDPVVGLEGVRRARQLTRKPLVAIGGITRANARSVLEAGADAVAVISDLIRSPHKSAEEFLKILG